MNNVSTPTTPADPHRISHGLQEDDADGPAQSAESNQYHDGSASTQNPSLSQAAREGLMKKLQFMIHLSISLDTLVYAELCALYYMEYEPPPLSYYNIPSTASNKKGGCAS